MATPAPAPLLPRAATIAVVVAGLVAAGFGLSAVQGIVAPVALAFVLTICVSPVKVTLRRLGVPPAIATGAVIGSTVIVLAAFVGAMVVALAQFTVMLPGFAPQFRELGVQLADAAQKIGAGPEQVRAIIATFDVSRIISLATNVLGGAGSLGFGLVIVLTMLLLMGQDASALPTVLEMLKPRRPHLVRAIGDYAGAVRRYMVATIVLGVVQGALNSVVLVILGVPGALLWGLLSFLCSFIPNVGFFIAIVPPLVFGLLVGGWPAVLWIIVAYSVINTVVQSIVQPRFVGGVVALSQTLTFLSVLVWAVVLGPIGAILAVPLTLLVRTLFVDADPTARELWRPLTGDVAEARARMRSAHASAKAERRRRNR